MHLLVNGVRLFVDVLSSTLVPSGPQMAERPTLLMLHGGPGADHSHYRPAWDGLADVAQLVYFDHRGNGRSEHGARAHWTLDQWADDVVGLCEALGISRPVVLGASFGGIVAQAYAARHPGHAARLVLVSTAARGNAFTERRVALFRALGGAAAGELAHRRLVLGDTSRDVLDAWMDIAVPLYTRSSADPDAARRGVRNAEATQWFTRRGGEGERFDLRAQLPNIRCPVLLMGGALDPMLPLENQREMAALLPPALLRYAEFDDAGHGVVPDAPARALALIRDFIAEETALRTGH